MEIIKSRDASPYETNVWLMLKFKQGDEDAFTKLMERNLQSVIGTITRFIGNKDEAEDLAQEVFIRIYNARVRYQPKAKFATWLYRIVSNICWNYLRDRKKRLYKPLFYKDTTGEKPRDITDVGQDTPSKILSNLELIDKVKEALQSLPPNQRMAVILSKYECLSYQEIAEAMDISIMAVKSLLNRAKENLKKRLYSVLHNGTFQD